MPAIDVPMQVLGNFPVVTAQIDGQNVPLMFDLGDASALVLTKNVLSRVKTVPTGKSERFQDAKGNVLVSSTFKVPRLQIGGAVFENVAGREDMHDPSYQATRVGQEGYFGTSLLKSYKLVLDYRRRTMTLIPPQGSATDSDRCKGTVVPFLSEWEGDPVTKAQTELGELTMVWDTGAPRSMIRKARAEEAHAGVTSQSMTLRSLQLGDVDFGPLEFHVLDYVEPAGTDGFIGYNFFADRTVCVDFPAKRLLIQ
jgi:hypothetical protein